MEELVRPGDGEELLPPTRGHVRDVETKDEGERDEIKECIEVFDYAFKQPETDSGRRLAQVTLLSYPLLTY